jgi:hypothetical protein
MSIKVMSLVWDNFKRGGSEKLVMLAMADWCNDHGGSLHPSVSTVAKKVCITEKQARVILHKLIKDGYLKVIGNEYGGNPGQSRQYQLNISMFTPPVEVTPNQEVTPPVEVRYPSCGGSFTPPVDGSLSTIEPSIEPPNKRAREKSKEITLYDYIDLCKEKKEKPIPDEDNIFDYAMNSGIPDHFLYIAWRVFVDKFIETDKKQKCWKQTFRNYVKSDYLKVWYFKDNECFLTNVGIAMSNQLRKAV